MAMSSLAFTRLGLDKTGREGKRETTVQMANFELIAARVAGFLGIHSFQLTKGSHPSTVLKLEGNRVNVYCGSHCPISLRGGDLRVELYLECFLRM